ncbi:DNA recombination protein RmuC [Flavitalea sp.]|nr:DNA recombination protein RmuC [Flavitalea sp.]
MSQSLYIIIIAIVFLVGLVIGLIINKYRLGNKINLLTSSKNSVEEQFFKTELQLENSSRALEEQRLAGQVGLQTISRLESRLEQQLINEVSLKESLSLEITAKTNVFNDRDQLREVYTSIKTKYDELLLANITVNNEKSRTKGQLEEYRMKEQTFHKEIADLSARTEEMRKNLETAGREKSDFLRNIQVLQAANTELVGQNHSLAAKYSESLKAIAEQKQFIAEAQLALKTSFDSLSAAALDKNNQSFLDLAKTELKTHISHAQTDLDKRQQAIDILVKPLGESLTRMDEKINTLESKREGAYGNISTLLDQMKLSTAALDKETRNLVTALKTSHTRGRYGEIALRRLVEFAGMMDQCDFQEQVTTEGEAGKLRPDMIIRLPENRSVVVDSKVPLSAYLQIFETDDAETQKRLLQQHAAAIRIHLKQLSAKAYWDQFPEAPDFVVLFMQIESSFGAALQEWPELIEEALNNRIIVATPTTLITILRSVGYSWNQLKTMENIESIRDAAVELYERSAILMEHMVNIGKGLNGTINHFNKAVGSLEGSFLPQGRRIQQMSQAYIKKQLIAATPIELAVRPITSLPPQKDENDLTGIE